LWLANCNPNTGRGTPRRLEMKVHGMIARIATAVLLFSGMALADYQLDFTVPTSSGTISYAGGAAPLIGANIVISDITSPGAPLNSGTSLTCAGCLLNFTSGSLISQTPGLYTFGGGGTFTLTGSIGGPSATLLSGSFGGNASVVSGGILDITAAFISTDVNSALSGYFGLPSTPPQYSGALGILSAAIPGQGGAFSGIGIVGGSIATSVPEPASIVLLGTVLLCCVAFARRRIA